MKQSTALGCLLALCAATSFALAQQGPQRLRVPEDMILPFYARINLDDTLTEIYHDDTWAAIVFYYDPAKVPDASNLLTFDFRGTTDGSFDMTMSGFLLWDPEAGAPSQMNLHGNGAVPVWFVSWPALQTAVADRILTMPELEALEPLEGTATEYSEEVHPYAHIALKAQGRLDEDGRRFQFHAEGMVSPPLSCCYGKQVRIRIW